MAAASAGKREAGAQAPKGAAVAPQVIYVREGVAAVVARRERIMGRLSLIRQSRVMFLAWLPYSPGSLLPDGTFLPPAVVGSAQPAARGARGS